MKSDRMGSRRDRKGAGNGAFCRTVTTVYISQVTTRVQVV